MKMKDQVLTIEQMRELIALGIKIDSASMIWEYKGTDKKHGYYNLEIFDYDWTFLTENDVPTFTFEDITNKLLPKYINIEDNTYFLTLMYDVSKGVTVCYCTEHIKDILHIEGSISQVNAAFKMLKWCKQNKHI